MKKIDFNTAIKALEEGKKVYKSDGKAYYERKTILHYNFNDEDYNKYEARNNNPQEWESLYLPEEPKPFRITKTGLYRTREGRRAFVAAQRAGVGTGCIDDFPMLLRWDLTGEVKDGYVDEFDIIGKWED